jgi:hypothetical protein
MRLLQNILKNYGDDYSDGDDDTYAHINDNNCNQRKRMMIFLL